MASPEVLQYLDLTIDLLLLDRLERLDDALLVVGDVDRLENLAILPPAQLADQLVVVLVAPLDHVALVVPVFAGAVRVDVCVDAGAAGQRHGGDGGGGERERSCEERTGMVQLIQDNPDSSGARADFATI